MVLWLIRQVVVALRARLFVRRGMVHRSSRRVGLGDLDINWHMNQRIYAGVAEMHRLEWFVASELWRHWVEQGIKPLVAEQNITYRRELKLLTRYEVDTRPVRIDGRLLVVDHWFVVGDRVHTHIEIKMLFVGRDGVLSADEVKERIGPIVQEPLRVEDWKVVG